MCNQCKMSQSYNKSIKRVFILNNRFCSDKYFVLLLYWSLLFILDLLANCISIQITRIKSQFIFHQNTSDEFVNAPLS